MKRALLLLLFLMSSAILCHAQYHNRYHDARMIASAIADEQENRMLNNTRFDERALQLNPAAWEEYQKYTQLADEYKSKAQTWGIVALGGIGVSCLALIPISSFSFDDFAWRSGVLTVGGITTLVGLVGATIQFNRIRENKREFIYYLKASNNGIGIVTLF